MAIMLFREDKIVNEYQTCRRGYIVCLTLTAHVCFVYAEISFYIIS